jgi:hypothetical protein
VVDEEINLQEFVVVDEEINLPVVNLLSGL